MISRLPIELVLAISSKLWRSDILNLALSCKSLHRILNTLLCTSARLGPIENGDVYGGPWDALLGRPEAERTAEYRSFLKKLEFSDYPRLPGSYNWEGKPKSHDYTKDLEALAVALPEHQLKALRLGVNRPHLEAVVQLISKQAKSLESLSLNVYERESIWNPSQYDIDSVLLSIKNLKSITLWHSVHLFSPYATIREIYQIFAQMPNLEDFTLRRCSDRDDNTETDPYPRDVRLPSSLRSMTLDSCYWIKEFVAAVLDFPPPQLQRVVLDTRDLPDIEPGYRLISKLRNLKNIHYSLYAFAEEQDDWDEIVESSPDCSFQWRALVENHKETLEHITVICDIEGFETDETLLFPGSSEHHELPNFLNTFPRLKEMLVDMTPPPISLTITSLPKMPYQPSLEAMFMRITNIGAMPADYQMKSVVLAFCNVFGRPEGTRLTSPPRLKFFVAMIPKNPLKIWHIKWKPDAGGYTATIELLGKEKSATEAVKRAVELGLDRHGCLEAAIEFESVPFFPDTDLN